MDPSPHAAADIDFTKKLMRFATWYDANRKNYKTFDDAVSAYMGAVMNCIGAYSSDLKNSQRKHFYAQFCAVQQRLEQILSDGSTLGGLDPFAELVAEEFDLFSLLAFSANRFVAVPGLDLLDERGAINHLLSKADPYVVHLAAPGEAPGGKPCTAFGELVESPGATATVPDGFSFAAPVKPVATAQFGGRKTAHKGLPVLVVPMSALPPQMFTVILEILARQGVAGVSFTNAGKRDNAPQGALGLRSFHQNEMGLLPAPNPDVKSSRGQAYHRLWESEGAEGLQNKQVKKNVELVETCLFEFNAVGFNNTNVRLVFDSSRDQFYLTFHYQVIKVAKSSGGGLECVKLASNADTLTALSESPSVGGTWISSMILIKVAPALKLDLLPVGPVRKQVEPTAPFPMLPMTPVFTDKWPCVSVSASQLVAAAKKCGLARGEGSDQKIEIFEKVKTSMFDLHLTCVVTSGVADTFHLAVRTNGRHGSVVYWWYRLVWVTDPSVTLAKLKKDAVVDDPKLEWHFDGPINGHGARDLAAMWASVEMFAKLIDGKSVLDDMLARLTTGGVRIRVVKSQGSNSSEAATYYHLEPKK